MQMLHLLKHLMFPILLLITVKAQAEGLYLTGVETSRDASYLYLGRMASIEHDQLQNGLAYRVWVDQIKYQYSSNGVTHRATAYGIEGGLGDLFTLTPKLSGSGFISLVARNTDISPKDPTSNAQGEKVSIKVQGDLNYRLGEHWLSIINASYTALNQAYWTRLRVMREFSFPLAVGIEVIKQGDATYSIDQVGVALTGLQLGKAGVGIKAGARRVSGESASPYVGVELGLMY